MEQTDDTRILLSLTGEIRAWFRALSPEQQERVADASGKAAARIIGELHFSEGTGDGTPPLGVFASLPQEDRT